MDFRTILGFALMFVVYFYFFVPKPQEQSPSSAPQEQVVQEELETAEPSKAKVTRRVINTAPRVRKPNEDLRTKVEVLENNNLRIEMNSLGEVAEVRLKNYTVSSESTENVVWDHRSLGGFNRTVLTTSLGSPEWMVSRRSSDRLVLVSNIDGLSLKRRISLPEDGYILTIEDEVLNKTKSTIRADMDVEIMHSEEGVEAPSLLSLFKPQADIREVSIMSDGSVWREPFASLESLQKGFDQPLLWAGFSYKFFFQGVIPQNVSIASVETQPIDKSFVSTRLRLAQKQITAGEKTSYKMAYFLGPKKMGELRKAGSDLDKVIDYGDWIGPISRMLLQILHFFYAVIPNYGIAIILLTFLVKLMLFPLAFKSTVSMRKLSLVQPKMKEIRDKYKEDKQRMQAEMMTLYREEKVNPVGGCLPLLLQMPVFFALYRLFFASIELRQTPFVGWIQDLSVHDPYFVTPVLMTILMWGQQKLTPMPQTDPDNEAVKIQMAMMKWMPIMFGAIMLFLPAGLTLYFLVNAAISIAQQFFLNKHMDKTMPRPSPVAATTKAG